MFFPLSCNDNNYMTYKWPNSSFFNFQENANQENCWQYSCIIFLIDKLEQRTWRQENLSLKHVFHKLDNNKCKCTRAHEQENKSIYIYLYISLYENLFENGYIYIYTTTCIYKTQ